MVLLSYQPIPRPNLEGILFLEHVPASEVRMVNPGAVRERDLEDTGADFIDGVAGGSSAGLGLWRSGSYPEERLGQPDTLPSMEYDMNTSNSSRNRGSITFAGASNTSSGSACEGLQASSGGDLDDTVDEVVECMESRPRMCGAAPGAASSAVGGSDSTNATTTAAVDAAGVASSETAVEGTEASRRSEKSGTSKRPEVPPAARSAPAASIAASKLPFPMPVARGRVRESAAAAAAGNTVEYSKEHDATSCMLSTRASNQTGSHSTQAGRMSRRASDEQLTGAVVAKLRKFAEKLRGAAALLAEVVRHLLAAVEEPHIAKVDGAAGQVQQGHQVQKGGEVFAQAGSMPALRRGKARMCASAGRWLTSPVHDSAVLNKLSELSTMIESAASSKAQLGLVMQELVDASADFKRCLEVLVAAAAQLRGAAEQGGGLSGSVVGEVPAGQAVQGLAATVTDDAPKARGGNGSSRSKEGLWLRRASQKWGRP
jgi:hypothetical protein